MNIGNNLYSTLSQSTKEILLLLTDFPAMVDSFGTSYELRYSESYSDVLSGDAIHSADFPYVMSLAAAFDSFLRENYNKLNLTIRSYAVAIYTLPNGRYKIFDSHSKDLLSMTHPLGTCSLIEIDSLYNLVQYFHSFHSQTTDATYEARDVSIHEKQSDSDNCVADYNEECIPLIKNTTLEFILSFLICQTSWTYVLGMLM